MKKIILIVIPLLIFLTVKGKSQNIIINRSGVDSVDIYINNTLNNLGVTDANVLIYNESYRQEGAYLTIMGIYAYTEELITFHLVVFNRLLPTERLKEIAIHEAYHIYQSHDNIFIHVAGGLIIYKDELYNAYNLGYLERPWELDAFRYSNKMTN